MSFCELNILDNNHLLLLAAFSLRPCFLVNIYISYTSKYHLVQHQCRFCGAISYTLSTELLHSQIFDHIGNLNNNIMHYHLGSLYLPFFLFLLLPFAVCAVTHCEQLASDHQRTLQSHWLPKCRQSVQKFIWIIWLSDYLSMFGM